MQRIVNPKQTRLFDPFDNVLTKKTRKRLLDGWAGVFRHVILELMPVETIYGLRDLYLTLHLPDGTWSTPQNLGPRINSAYFECGPRISPDKKYLFFTRAKGWWENSSRDTSDIYWVELKEYLSESYR